MAVRLGIDSTYTRKPLRILVADSDEVSAESMRHLLVEHGHEVKVVHDGLEALNQLCTQWFHLLLLGSPLTTIDSAEVLSALKKHIETQRLVVFMLLDGEDLDKEVFEAYKNGADLCLSKPVSEEELMRFISTIGLSG